VLMPQPATTKPSPITKSTVRSGAPGPLVPIARLIVVARAFSNALPLAGLSSLIMALHRRLFRALAKRVL